MVKKLVQLILGVSVLMGVLAGCGCKHEFEAATCQKPATCKLCGETEGDIADHQWENADCIKPKSCSVCGETEGDPIGHKWTPATCTEPKTCSVCGQIEGEALGHQWEVATCTEPKICSVCKDKEGEPLGHKIDEIVTSVEPTCTKQGTGEGKCTVCGETVKSEIPALGHEPGEWEVVKEATFYEGGKKAKLCIVCGEEVENEDYELSDEEKMKWYKRACESISYKSIARTPDDYKGKNAVIKGEVSYIVEENKDGKSMYMIYTRSTYGCYIEDPFYIFIDDSQIEKSRILEGDIITCYGELDGLYDFYSSKFPQMNVKYYEIKESN